MSREVHVRFCVSRGVRFPPATHQLVWIAAELCGDRGYTAIQPLPGVGPTLAAVFVAEIGDMHRFADSAHLCSWVGLTPKHRESETVTVKTIHPRSRCGHCVLTPALTRCCPYGAETRKTRPLTRPHTYRDDDLRPWMSTAGAESRAVLAPGQGCRMPSVGGLRRLRLAGCAHARAKTR